MAWGQTETPAKPSIEPDFPLATPSPKPWTYPGPLTFKEKSGYYWNSAFSLPTIGRVAATSTFGHLSSFSEDWGTGWNAYGRRMGNNYIRHVMSTTLRYGIGVARGEDPRFFESGKQGFWPRAKFAMGQTFSVHMDNGKRSVAAGRLIGIYGGNALGTHIRSGEEHPWRQSVINSGFSIGTNMGVNVLREFWPDIKNRMRREPRANGTRQSP